MSLEAVIGSIGGGRVQKNEPLSAEVERALTADDIVRLATRGDGPGSVPLVKELRTHHHSIARSLAQGMHRNEVAIKEGISPQRISQLETDPQFIELLEYYRAMEKRHYENVNADTHARLAALGHTSIEVLHGKLLDEPEKFKTGELLAIVTATSDRTGFGRTSRVDHEHVHSLDEAQLARIRGEADAPARVAEEDRQALLSFAVRATEVLSGPEAPEGCEGEGADLRDEGREGAQAEGQGPRVA